MKSGRSVIVLLLAGTMLALSVSAAGAWTYSTAVVEYQGSSHIIGTKTGQTYMFRVGIATNDSADAQTLEVEFNYHDDFVGQYWYSIDSGASWIELPKGQAALAVQNVASGDSVWLRAVLNYYRYLSTSPWGEADTSIGDEYYFAFSPGGKYYDRGTTNVNKTGFVAVAGYSGPEEDQDHDGQSVSQGDCNDLDDTIYTGASEVCGDGIDQDCDGSDESCFILTVFSGGQIWMDRNLGASRAATTYSDAEAFGDLYQWGRRTDGHENRTSATTSTLSTSDIPGHGKFINTNGAPHDWRTPQNNSLWQGESGINNPCPSGFRLPTETELSIEIATWTDPYDFQAPFHSPLKLVLAGQRDHGYVYFENLYGYYWSSTVSNSKSRNMFIDTNAEFFVTSSTRNYGFSVRCIQDNDPDADMDQDGQSIAEGDCNDQDDSIYTGAPEICGDGIDQDCDGADCEDQDQDGQSVSQGDCNDHDDTIYTGAPEICGDDIDQNCDGWDEPCDMPEGTVISAGRIWMDRNLGASRVATNLYDYEAYGDYYQWGRGADGHEKSDSETTEILSSSDDPGHGKFITPTSSPLDWRASQNDDLWQGESGINNPCPAGFRLPTATELQIERDSWNTSNAAGAFASPAKFVRPRGRSYNGSLGNGGTVSSYWSSTVHGQNSKCLEISSSNAYIVYDSRAYGNSVRCIQD